ncbi:hypothetical protein BLS_000457 [Venturia inaequalis]|uniref:Uncharacterized protein n=1 Tax=Venturia inaequalis TaxID=5025 RepID=A0A8H3U4Z6_VENIN|nr:hypothetical protein BLS_000457 [Venturia inaequalis]
MGPRKSQDEYSKNEHTQRELRRRAGLSDDQRRRRLLKAAMSEAIRQGKKKLQSDPEFTQASEAKRQELIDSLIKSIEQKRIDEGKHPNQVEDSMSDTVYFPPLDRFDDSESESEEEQDASSEPAGAHDDSTNTPTTKADLSIRDQIAHSAYHSMMFNTIRRAWHGIDSKLKEKIDQRLMRIKDNSKIWTCLTAEELSIMKLPDESDARSIEDRLKSITPSQFFTTEEQILIRNYMVTTDHFATNLPGPSSWWEANYADEVDFRLNVPDQERAKEAFDLIFGSKKKARARYVRLMDIDLTTLQMLPIDEQLTNPDGSLKDDNVVAEDRTPILNQIAEEGESEPGGIDLEETAAADYASLMAKSKGGVLGDIFSNEFDKEDDEDEDENDIPLDWVEEDAVSDNEDDED